MDLRKSDMVTKMKQMRKARRELLYHQIEATDQENANKTAANLMKRANNAKNPKRFAAGLIGLEQIAKLYEMCPEVPISAEIAKLYENRNFGEPTSKKRRQTRIVTPSSIKKSQSPIQRSRSRATNSPSQSKI